MVFVRNAGDTSCLKKKLMIEIVVIIILTRNIGRICKSKNIKPVGYQFMTVILWILFEFIGGIIGAIFFPDQRAFAYLFALIGAGLSALISYNIAKNLKTRNIVDSKILDSEII